MSSLTFMRPLPYSIVSSSLTGAARVATGDPKEAAFAPNTATQTLVIDMGQSVTIDQFLWGYTNATPSSFNVVGGNTTPPNNQIATINPVAGDGGGPQHYLVTLAAPVTYRYFSFGTNMAAGAYVGVVALGAKLQPQNGVQWGAGRPLDDTSNVERLFGGGFGVDLGVVTTGYTCTCDDLTSDELRQLYTLVRRVGRGRNMLIVEDPDQTAGLNERIHWGLLQKLETYERIDPINNRWAFTIGDWA